MPKLNRFLPSPKPLTLWSPLAKPLFNPFPWPSSMLATPGTSTRSPPMWSQSCPPGTDTYKEAQLWSNSRRTVSANWPSPTHHHTLSQSSRTSSSGAWTSGRALIRPYPWTTRLWRSSSASWTTRLWRSSSASWKPKRKSS